MDSQSDESGERIDRKTSRSICQAVAERLQQSLHAEPLPPHLEHLMGELRRHDDAGAAVRCQTGPKTCGTRPFGRPSFGRFQ
jgi:hypothetical protein